MRRTGKVNLLDDLEFIFQILAIHKDFRVGDSQIGQTIRNGMLVAASRRRLGICIAAATRPRCHGCDEWSRRLWLLR